MQEEAKQPSPEALECQKSLRKFYESAWPIIEPATPFVGNWHIDAICEHLEAAVRRIIRNLIVTMPPRMSKSTLCSVTVPAWVWTFAPSERFLYASYAQSLSTRDSVFCRRLIQSPWYQRLWGHTFKLTSDQNIKMRFENNRTGLRLATSVGAAVTGEGGDFLVIDDAHNAQEASSDTVRQGVLDWWDTAMSTRLNNIKTGVRIVVMQRLHHKDLVGHLLETGDWYHLSLPMEYEGVPTQWVIGWNDPRTEEGELLWPERYPREEVEKLKRALGSYGAAAQLQQRPTPSEGGIFKQGWFRQYKIAPPFLRIIESWDTATSESDFAAYSVGTVWGEAHSGDIYLLDVCRKRMEFPELKRAVISLHDKWRGVATLVEDKSSGRQVVQELRRDTAIPLVPIKVTKGDKVARALVVSPLIEGGRVFIPEDQPWLATYMAELMSFPRGEFADQVDSTTQALSWLRGGSQAARIDFT